MRWPGFSWLLAVGLSACTVSTTPEAGQGALPQRVCELVTARARLALTVEWADTPEAQATGLMWRAPLPPLTGMLFVWPTAANRVFWMKNTPAALDLIFLRSGRVVGLIEYATPLSEAPLTVAAPADMVLEWAAGQTQAHQVRLGDRLRC